MASGIGFDVSPYDHNPAALLGKALGESSSYINVVVAAARLDYSLYEQILTANHNGHFVALIYFSSSKGKTDRIAEGIYRQVMDSGAACYKVVV
jgi:hypothetical protein